jgi:flavin reductase (DIM6/NTAB) family NADH-FMN oxidoreductase RutF
MHIDAAALDTRANYFLLTSLLIPRPVAWTATRSAEGRDNLAPFSYFMGVGSRPPRVAISVARGRRGVLKDTARNLLETGQATISIASMDMLEALNQSSAAYPPDTSEFEILGLAAVAGTQVAASRPALAGVTLEVQLDQALDLGDVHLFVLRVLGVHVRDDWLLPGETLRVDPAKLNPVARLGGTYAAIGPEIVLPRAVVG